MSAEPLIAAEGWSPPGGYRFAFFTTNAELQELLERGLPAELAPWRLTGSDPVERLDSPGQYLESPWVRDDLDLAACATGPSGRPRANIFAWSERLTTALPPLEIGSQYEALCCFNGFLLVQPSRWREDRGYSDAAISVMERVVHVRTREERRYPEYLHAFNRLKSLITERLVAPSLLSDRAGNEYASQSTMWTRAAIAAHASGIRFDCRPALGGDPGSRRGGFGSQDRLN
jgi:hypothetical protein